MNEGRTTGRITAHDLRTNAKGTPYLNLGIEVEGESIQCPIYLTEKSMNMARAQLQICGFDVDRKDLSEVDGTQLLVGVQVPVEISEENGRLRCQIVLQRKPNKAEIDKITRGLRSAKKESDPLDDGIPF